MTETLWFVGAFFDPKGRIGKRHVSICRGRDVTLLVISIRFLILNRCIRTKNRNKQELLQTIKDSDNKFL